LRPRALPPPPTTGPGLPRCCALSLG